jgi:hypothetical protein
MGYVEITLEFRSVNLNAQMEMPARSINGEMQWRPATQTPEITLNSASALHVMRLICALFR